MGPRLSSGGLATAIASPAWKSRCWERVRPRCTGLKEPVLGCIAQHCLFTAVW